MKIALASDHRGFEFKKHVASMLTQMGHTVKDFGTTTGTESVDYPDYGLKAARSVGSGERQRDSDLRYWNWDVSRSQQGEWRSGRSMP